MKSFIYSKSTGLVLPVPDDSYLVSDTEAGRYIIKNDIFERPLIEWCKQFGNKDKVFLDIGAHMGTYCIELSPYFSKCYAFEPQKSTFYQLCSSVFMHRIDNIDCRNVAVSNVAATSRLNVISEDGGGSSLRTDGTHANPITSEIVETVVLDDLNLHDIGFIKIDVEGFEDKVISGGLKTLEASNFPMILFESNNSSDFNNVVSVLPKVYTVNGINGIPNMFIAHKI